MKKHIISLIMIAMAALPLVSCDPKNTEPETPVNETAEDILSAVQDIYTVESCSENTSYYIITFHNPSPVTVKKEHKDGIPSVSVRKSVVEHFSDNGKYIDIEMTGGSAFRLTYENYLVVTLDTDVLAFSKADTQKSLRYVVEESCAPDVKVSVQGTNGFAGVVVEPDETGNGGTITFVTTTSGQFEISADIVFDNGVKTIRKTVTLGRYGLSFSDGTVTRSYEFMDHAREFILPLSEKKENVKTTITQDGSWIQAIVGDYTAGEESGFGLVVYIPENVGNRERHGTIKVAVAGTKDALTVDITQKGTEQQGAFKRGLKAFYNALGGDGWWTWRSPGSTINWRDDVPVAQWYGLAPLRTADASAFGVPENVYFGDDEKWTLRLYNAGLRGAIPEEFWDICRCFVSITINCAYLDDTRLSEKLWHKDLRVVNFARTYMGGELTSAVLNAPDLEVLNFDRCCLEGTLRPELTSLSQLRELNLSTNYLSGELPQDLGRLQNLEVLNVSDMEGITGCLPDSFYDLVNLRTVVLASTNLGGTLSSRIANLKIRRNFTFTIGGCNFEGDIPEEFGLFDKSTLGFGGNFFTKLPEYVRYRCEDNQWIIQGGRTPADGATPYMQRDIRAKGISFAEFDRTYRETFTKEKITERSPYKNIHVETVSRRLPYPVWAHVKYGTPRWDQYDKDNIKTLRPYPYADDLQYPADEYYYDADRKAWCHPKLEFPAREYYFDGKEWIHDASCPWDEVYYEYHEWPYEQM